MSILKPAESVTVGLGVAAGVFAIYGNLPSVPEIRITEPNDPDMVKTERGAAWFAIGVVSGIALLTKDPTVFVIGGLAMIGASIWHQHANAFDPATGRVEGGGAVPIGRTYAQMADESIAEAPGQMAY